ncbi:SCO2322 family protein [Kitasatospora sp. NPDC047058]|uniref:SCO2322 family protein n=1 Tax=Kitasatospora sp. NPDC047058 TaxID=3155620 RepID=UPI0034075305
MLRFAAGVVAGVLILLMLGAAPAEAAGYRYWSFWKWSDGAWAYQQQGPALYVPPDGTVDGWRFAVSPDGGRDAARPGTAGDFASVCGGTPGQQGRKRVAVVLDFGTAADAAGENPPGQRSACAVVPAKASSAEVLATIAPPLRYDTNGLLCAIAGYPRSGCGEQLGAADQPGAGAGPGSGSGSDSGSGTGSGSGSGSGPGATPPAGSVASRSDSSSSAGGPDLGVIGGAVLVAALAAGAVWQARRRR